MLIFHLKKKTRMECNGLQYLELRKEKIELIQKHLAPSPERDAIESQVNAGNVEYVSYTRDKNCAQLTVRYYSGGESIFNL